MAAAVAGGSFLSASLQVLFDRLASRDFINFLRGQKQTEGLLRNLKAMLLALKSVVDHAEYRQFTNSEVKEWVDELKDVIYRADDLLDEIATQAMRSKLNSEVNNIFSYSVDSLFGEGIASKLEEIIKSLEYFVDTKDFLSLRQDDGGKINPSHRLPTTSLMDEVSIYGRDDDKKNVIQELLSEDSNGDQISVIPLVGMGGIGKTTLAQFVYNDARVDQHFDMKSWVCVSEEFDILRVTKTILETISKPYDTSDLNLLQVKLQNNLRGKKFLFVLDDVWNENKSHWDSLQKPFRVAAHGSKIIITTRNEDVARIMRTVPIFRLEQLSYQECWLIFSQQAFKKGNPSVQPNLEAIGKKIVEKCKGLPLAAKTLGALLRFEEEIVWVIVLQKEIWDLPYVKSNILPALKLSYLHLPSHLKPCFAYCAIIPKDYEFGKETLVRLWIAEGLIQQPRNNISIEEMGADYFRELVSRSLLQHSSGEKFVMHDLINDLAQFVSGEFCFRFEENKLPNISKVRYYSIFTKGLSLQEFVVINEAKCLRTFLSLRYYGRFLQIKVTADLLSTLRCLRVLSLKGYDIAELPGSIGYLIHLRYLDLSSSKIKCLPESISGLCNLETLLLQGCGDLTRLPTHLCKLICLRHLDISETLSLKEMPKQIGRLSSLQLLPKFIVGKDTGTSISELRGLDHLHGTLYISNLQNVTDGRDAMEANLKNKEHLEELILEWSDENSDDSDKYKEVLSKLQTHVNLKKLTIKSYSGTRFPDWEGHQSFLNISYLYLSTCNNSSSLPSVGKLPSLKDLTIKGMNKLVNIGSEFYGDGSTINPFQALERLRFEDMPEWEKWYILGAGEFCHLQEFRIINCPKLKWELPDHLPSLKKLEIDECPSLDIQNILGRPVSEDTELHHYKSLEELVTSCSCDSLVSYPLGFFPKLRSLKIYNCKNLKSLSVIDSRVQNLTSLQYLGISGCPKMESFAEGGLPAPNLTWFKIDMCEKMKSLPEQMCTLLPSLQTLTMCNLPEIESFPEEGGLPHSLSNLDIRNCKKLIGRRREWGLQRLPSLKLLTVGGESEEDKLLEEYSSSFPEECLLPASLTSLTIMDRQNMKTLNPNGLRHLHSLMHLSIHNCQNLQCLPDEGLPTSLSGLSIWKCPMLKERCQRDTGQDWLKIAHIPTRVIH